MHPVTGGRPRADPASTVLLILYATDDDRAFAESGPIASGVGQGQAMVELTELRGDMLPGEVAHFGYRDGFSQPTISGGLPNPVPDALSRVSSRRIPAGIPEPVPRPDLPRADPDVLG